MTPADLECRVRHMAWPAPSPDLRARILLEASVAGPSITWSDRLWFSPAFRLSIGVATVVLLAVQVLSGPGGTGSLAPTPRALAEAQVIDETGRQLGLPPDLAASLARRALADRRPRVTDPAAWSAIQWLDQNGEPR